MALTGYGLLGGQSNEAGAADELGAGTSTTSGGDSSGKFSTAFASCLYSQLSAAAPANPMVYNTNFGVTSLSSTPVSLQTYAAAGVPNTGLVQSLGRALVKYGSAAGITQPRLNVFSVWSSSLPGHWAKASNFPASGTTIYNQFIAFAQSDMAASGKAYEFLVWLLGETDCATPARVTSAVSDMTTFFANVRADLGIPSLPVFMILINPAIGTGDVTGYRAQQVAYAATDPNCFLIDPATIPVDAPPHYKQPGYWSLGDMSAIAILKQFAPAASRYTSAGAFPVLHMADPAASSQASPSRCSPRSGADVQPGDYEVCVVASYVANATHTAFVAAGFTQLGTQFQTVVSGTSFRTISLWGRPVTSGAMTAGLDGVPRMPTPTFDCGSATLCFARIFPMHNVDGTTPIVAAMQSSPSNTSNLTTLSLGTAGLSGTALTGTTPVNNCTALVVLLHAGTTNSLSSLTGSNLSGVTTVWDGRVNPGAGTVGYAVATGQLATAGAIGTLSATFATATPGVGVVLMFQPATVTAVTTSTTATTRRARLAATVTSAVAVAASSRTRRGLMSSSVSITVPGGSDSTPPTASATFPAGQSYDAVRLSPVVIPVVDAGSAITLFAVSVRFGATSVAEAIYMGGGEPGGFLPGYTQSAISGNGAAGVGYTLTVRRDQSWPRGVSAIFTVRAADAKGNIL